MRNLKKFLALVLAMVMAMSLMVTANAVTANVTYPDDSQADPAFDEAIKVLSGMLVFQGDGGDFKPTRNVTRAEVAELIYRLYTGDVSGAQEGLYAKYGNFPDVTEDKWYAGAVGYCANAGLIKGRPDGTFDPIGNVTGYEVLAMILRAVGYDKNGEFTGPNWQTEVSSLSQQLGVVNNVRTTQYGGTLYLAARRDVVADLLFQTVAYVPQVQYTTAFGYQQYGMEGGVVGSVKNETLGHKVFGLTNHKGVIVGNESTGEGEHITKVGFSLYLPGNTAGGAAGTIDDNLTIHRLEKKATNGQYYFASAYNYFSDYGIETQNPGNVTLTFKWDSTLDQFNHAMKVWYDDRATGQTESAGFSGTVDNTYHRYTFNTNLTTYAMLDKSTKVSVVTDVTGDAADNATAGDASIHYTNNADFGNLYTAATNKTSANRRNNWAAPAFNLRTADLDSDGTIGATEYAAYFNYAFTRMNGGMIGATAATSNYGDDAIGAGSAISPIKKNEGGSSSEDWPLYLLISNSPNGELDVVISLDMTFSQVVEANNTRDPYSTGVTNYNNQTGYFDLDDVPGTGTYTYTNIAQENMVEKDGSEKILGKKIAAIEITGTAGKTPTAGIADDNQGGYATPAGGSPTMQSEYYYKLEENKIKQTGTVIRIDTSNQDVHLADGTVLHQSVFAEAVEGNFTHNIEGVKTDDPSGTWKLQLEVNRSYEFTLDEQGHYIYWETASKTSNFVYGTYLDFTSALASSAFDYPMVYVDTNGQQQQKNITSVKDYFNVNGLTDASNNSSIDGSMDALRYNQIQINKRDSANTSVTSLTAGYLKGRYVGYAMSDSGALTAVGPFNSTNPGTTTSGDQDTGFWQGSNTDFGDPTLQNLTIPNTNVNYNGILLTPTDGAVGAKQIPFAGTTGFGNVSLFLTENTQFYLVDGAGTANLKVASYKGISELLDGMDSVIIDAITPIANDSILADNNYPYEMVYYHIGDYEYAQSYVQSAKEIDTVFIPMDCVKFNKSSDSTLAFIGNHNGKLISSVGPHATRFTFYKDGVAGDYWVAGYINEANTAAEAVFKNGSNVFYSLVLSGDTAADGQPIYTIRNVTNPNTKLIGRYYVGYDMSTKTFRNGNIVEVANITSGNRVDPAEYAATTYQSQVAYIDDAAQFPNISVTAKLWNVGSATVTNLDKAKYPGIADNNLTTLNQAGSLTDNERVEVSCVLKNESPYRTVTSIYVNYNQDVTDYSFAP